MKKLPSIDNMDLQKLKTETVEKLEDKWEKINIIMDT